MRVAVLSIIFGLLCATFTVLLEEAGVIDFKSGDSGGPVSTSDFEGSITKVSIPSWLHPGEIILTLDVLQVKFRGHDFMDAFPTFPEE